MSPLGNELDPGAAGCARKPGNVLKAISATPAASTFLRYLIEVVMGSLSSHLHKYQLETGHRRGLHTLLEAAKRRVMYRWQALKR